MSVWGCAGKFTGLFRSVKNAGRIYQRDLHLRGLKKEWHAGYAKEGSEGGIYGSMSALSKWARGYSPGRKNSPRVLATRHASLFAATSAASYVGAKILHRKAEGKEIAKSGYEGMESASDEE